MSKTIDLSQVTAKLTADNTISITFPGSIREFAAQLEENGSIPLEYIALALSRSVALKTSGSKLDGPVAPW